MKTEQFVGEAFECFKRILPFSGLILTSMLALTVAVIVFADEPGSWAWPFFIWGSLLYALLGAWTAACAYAELIQDTKPDRDQVAGGLTLVGVIWWISWIAHAEQWEEDVYKACDYWAERLYTEWQAYRKRQEEFRTRTMDAPPANDLKPQK